ncbi:MAG TPA: hypothetical protein VMT85_12840 [Thermoanaerobaculia bacterium]|nr:hypothetical protein [Thermoanaerobaculia bacterium]
MRDVSGLFKVVGEQADIDVFEHLGMSATAVAFFGATQAIAGVTTAVPPTRRYGGVALAL